MSDTVDLKEYLNSRIDDVKDSVKTAYTSMEKRLESMNEFRTQLKDQAARFVTREEMESKIDNLVEKMESLQKIVYVGLGAVLALEFLLRFFIK